MGGDTLILLWICGFAVETWNTLGGTVTTKRGKHNQNSEDERINDLFRFGNALSMQISMIPAARGENALKGFLCRSYAGDKTCYGHATTSKAIPKIFLAKL